MGTADQQKLEQRARDLEEYLEGLTAGGGRRHTLEDGTRVDNVESEIAKLRQELDDLKRRIAKGG